jgi:hypothetical protein
LGAWKYKNSNGTVDTDVVRVKTTLFMLAAFVNFKSAEKQLHFKINSLSQGKGRLACQDYIDSSPTKNSQEPHVSSLTNDSVYRGAIGSFHRKQTNPRSTKKSDWCEI